MSSFVSQWNEFFHSRTGNNNSYGLCILFDRIMLTLDFKMLFFIYYSYHLKSCGVLIHTDRNIIFHPVSTIHVTSDEKLPVKKCGIVLLVFQTSFFLYQLYYLVDDWTTVLTVRPNSTSESTNDQWVLSTVLNPMFHILTI